MKFKQRGIKFRLWNKENKEIYYDLYPTAYGNEAEHLVWMQYTGLKDKNGTEIYEGDYLIDARDGREIGVVEYRMDEASYCGIHITDRWQHALSSDEQDVYLVIGNIFENPELSSQDTPVS